MSGSNEWQPTASLPVLRRRAALLAATRRFFDERGFFEVQTPVLSSETMIDRHIEPIAVELELAGDRRTYFLQTSPEFAMKRLLAAGAQAIYQLGPAFRGREAGAMHNPEFTMLEWYRTGDTYGSGIELLSEYWGSISGRGDVEVVTFQEVFRRHAGIDPFAASDAELREALPESFHHRDSLPREHVLLSLLAERVQPHLGNPRPNIVCDWPEPFAALAKIRPAAVPVAERFELFVDGIELANGYHELTDAQELRRRLNEANEQRRKDGGRPLSVGGRLFAAHIAGMPAGCGVAVGFDRLVMILSGRQSIRDVMPFPIDRA
jgi:lysyl-tRNA synthetase class 2